MRKLSYDKLQLILASETSSQFLEYLYSLNSPKIKEQILLVRLYAIKSCMESNQMQLVEDIIARSITSLIVNANKDNSIIIPDFLMTKLAYDN